MTYLLGSDIGTSATKGVLIDVNRTVIATASADYALSTPHSLWSEQDPADWWRATRQVLARVRRDSGVQRDAVVGLRLAGQMHGAVFRDAHREAIRPAILWNDGRTTQQCASITERVGAEWLITIAGNPALTGFQAPNIVWLHEKRARTVRSRTERAAT